jgi:hypothetical protein
MVRRVDQSVDGKAAKATEVIELLVENDINPVNFDIHGNHEPESFKLTLELVAWEDDGDD